MPTSCEVDFENNPMKVLYAGTVLRGTVRLNLTEEKTVRGIYIRIQGEAYVRWTRGSGKRRRTYTASEDYLDEKTYFVGGSSGEIRIEPGSYHYTFECLLPASLPTSVEGAHGHIRYTARVVFDIPMWPDNTFEYPFTVIKAINLNDDPVLRVPVVAQKNKTFFLCCLMCCCSSNPMKIVARTPVGGYTPGQTINLEIKVNNQSDQPVSEFSVQLQKEIMYSTHSGRTKVQHISITEQDTHGCGANEQEIIRANIVVPPIPPTDISTSKILKVRYLIRIIGSVTDCHNNPVLKVPITIGSYPIQDHFASQSPSAQPSNDVNLQQPSAPPPLPNRNNHSAQPDSNAPTPQFPFPNEDPPTYEEAMQMDDPNENNFKPKYPMFKRTTSYSSGN